jgi:glutamate/tyrosine decarboxylase-like PLP-dependent enzyme
MSELFTLTKEQMKDLGYKAVDQLIEHLTDLPNKSVGCRASRSDLEQLLREPIPKTGMLPESVFEIVERTVLKNTLHVNHPRFFAFVPSPGNFVSVLADMLASGYNVFAGTWMEGSGPAEIELVTIDWLRELCGMPKEAGGLFVSGGSMANMTALALARNTKLKGQIEKGVIYCSDQTHASVDRGLKILGFESAQIRRLKSDSDFRIPIGELKMTIASDRTSGRIPFCLVGNAGTTNTGSIDPLLDLVKISTDEDLWLHIDGSYGTAVVLCENHKNLLEGIGHADSITLDPHKWMFQPYEIGCLLVRDRKLLSENFHYLPEYLKDADSKEGEINFYDFGFQLTRSFRALKLWLSFKIFGLEEFKKAIEYGLFLAEEAENRIVQSPHLSLVTPAQLGMISFYFKTQCNGLQNDVNRQIVAKLMEDGYALLNTTQLRGRTVLHMCTINPRTEVKDVVDTLDKIEEIGQKLVASGQL